MTKSYVESAQKQFESLKTDVTSKSIGFLTLINSLSAGAVIIGLLQSDESLVFTKVGLVYAIVLVVIGVSMNKILDLASRRQKYDVTDVAYEKIKQ
jgi:hypothetical protein